MVVVYGVIAVFIAWIWVDYYRLIDVFQKESLKYFILTFLLGACSVFIVLGLNNYVLSGLPFELNGEVINDFLYCVFKIGLLEEVAKTIPFLVFYFLFKKQLNEPIDFLAFVSVSALGFSAAENVLYFQKYGPTVINGRAMLSTVAHMFATSLVAYGIIRYKFYYGHKGFYRIFLYLLLAALSHGFYDFWLIFEGAESWGVLVTVLYFFLTISVFAVIVNNAINNSAFFSYKKIIYSDKVALRLLVYYGIVFLAQFSLLVILEDAQFALYNLRDSIFVIGFIVAISCVRMSRFKLIKNRWENLRLEFPFAFAQGDPFGMRSSQFLLRVRGESFNDAYVNLYHEEFCLLSPLSARNTFIGKTRLIYIERIVFLKNDETFYLAKVFHNDEKGPFDHLLLKQKQSGTTMVNEKYPIVAVLKIEDLADLENLERTAKDFGFYEWAFIQPRSAE
jgi:RsiW-degrading membrane proteinase PrsW (M82 family)